MRLTTSYKKRLCHLTSVFAIFNVTCYKKNMSKRDAEFLQLEADVHDAMTPWIADFGENRSGGNYFDIGYNPDKYPEQRLDVGYTPPKQYPGWIPDRIKFHRLKQRVARH